MKREQLTAFNPLNDAQRDTALSRRSLAVSWLRGLLAWHKKLAWIAGIAVIFWGLTGVLHPIMSALSPAVQPLPPAAALPAHFSPVALASLKLAPGQVQSARLRMLDGQPAWRIGLIGQPSGLWFDAISGAAIVDADQREAERLARALVGDSHSVIASMTPITEFSRSYPSINKMLPVWRVEFARDDGMIAFVDTEGARLASLSDSTKRSLMPIFSLLHTWSWASDPLKKTGITVLLGCALLSMIGGLAMYVLRWRLDTLKSNQPRLRRVHRGVGVAVGVAGIAILSSGLAHLWLQKSQPRIASATPLAVLPSLPHVMGAFSELIAVNVAGQGYWLTVQSKKDVQGNTLGGHHHAAVAPSALPQYLNAIGMPEAGIAERHAAQIVKAAAHRDAQVQTTAVKSVRLITQFGGEYGFFQKRLPVYRVDLATPDAASWYVEPATGTFSTRVDDSDRFEGYLFANLHKWHWLDGLGKTSRDVILASFAAANVLLAVMGLCLLRRRKATAAQR